MKYRVIYRTGRFRDFRTLVAVSVFVGCCVDTVHFAIESGAIIRGTRCKGCRIEQALFKLGQNYYKSAHDASFKTEVPVNKLAYLGGYIFPSEIKEAQ